MVIASMNGNWYKESSCTTPSALGSPPYPTESSSGSSSRIVDAGEEGVEHVAAFHHLPVGHLDAGLLAAVLSCMHGPRRRAGGVAALEGVRTPSKVAKVVMDQTDHHLLVGAGAQAFARAFGFTIEDDLNTGTPARRGSSGSASPLL
jgi:hypothetical protein